MLVKVLHTFSSTQEGKRVHKDSILDLPDARVKALMHATPGRPLVRPLRADEVAAHKEGPKAKVEPDSAPPRRSPSRPTPGAPAPARNPRQPAKGVAKTEGAGARARKAIAAGVETEPKAPRPLAIGKAGSAAPGASSSPAGQARAGSTTRPRGTRSPKQGGSPSTTPGA